VFQTLSLGNAGHFVPGRSKPVPAGAPEFVVGARCVVGVVGGAGTTVVVVAGAIEVVVEAADVDGVAGATGLYPAEPCKSDGRVSWAARGLTVVDVGMATSRRGIDDVVHPAIASIAKATPSARGRLIPRTGDFITIHDRSR